MNEDFVFSRLNYNETFFFGNNFMQLIVIILNISDTRGFLMFNVLPWKIFKFLWKEKKNKTLDYNAK